MPIEPRLAPVVPRVVPDRGVDELTVEDFVRPHADSGTRGVLAITGAYGSGKTTALAHLAAALGDAVACIDEDDASGWRSHRHAPLVVYAAERPRRISHLRIARMKPWGEDEVIEYLLATRPDRCASVMARLSGAARAHRPPLETELKRLVLDWLASDDALPDAIAALDAALSRVADDGASGHAALEAVLRRLSPEEAAARLNRSSGSPEFFRLVRHREACVFFAARRVALDLGAGHPVSALSERLPTDFIAALGRRVAAESGALDGLSRLFESRARFFFRRSGDATPAMTASVLHAAGGRLVPRTIVREDFRGAALRGIDWKGVDLRRACLSEADLSDAVLEGSRLDGARVVRAFLRGVRLARASFAGARFAQADLTGADFEGASGPAADFGKADLTRVRAGGASLPRCEFVGADLSAADFTGSDLRHAVFAAATLAGADFAGARLQGARLANLRLRRARFDGASLDGAHLTGSDLEFVRWPEARLAGAKLESALLTGAAMPRAVLTRASLTGAGLADVDFQGADLRLTDFTNASFHLGSSRSGLVWSPIACEGSRTGFYTDESFEQTFRSPEEIRKADLRGADLRGASVTGTDFYLVDLRGAIYTEDQARHFKRCRAILENATGRSAS